MFFLFYNIPKHRVRFPFRLSLPALGAEPGLHTATPASGGPRVHLPLDQLHDALCVYEEDLAVCLTLQRGGMAVQDGGYLDKNTKHVRPLPATGSSGHRIQRPLGSIMGDPHRLPGRPQPPGCTRRPKPPGLSVTALSTPSVSPWGPRSSE